jgi:23S rRNA (guanosine2251-2'-O)-methyltransferase
MVAYVAGRHAVMEAIEAGQRVRRVLVDARARQGDPSLAAILQAATQAHIAVQPIPRQRLDAIHPRHQGVVAEVDPFRYAALADVLGRAKAAGPAALVLALDSLQDPQNFGTLLRTALAVDAKGVIFPEHRAVDVTPAVVRASAGAAERLAIAQVANLAQALEQCKTNGLWVVGLDAHAKQAYDEVDLSGPIAVVVGSEGTGLRRLVAEKCDVLVRLPMAGPTESLNAAVAGSILLYHLFRQRAREQTPSTVTPG